MVKPQQAFRVGMMFHGARDVGAPYVGECGSNRVLCFMNMSGAYGGSVGLPEAKQDAAMFAASPCLQAALAKAERFISGFEGDELQLGIDELLREMRAALKSAVASEV